MGGAVLMGGGFGLWRLRGTAPGVAGLKTLSAHEHRTMKALAATIVPRGGPFELGADDFDLARAFDNFLADEPPENISDLKRALLLVEYGPVLFERRWITFSNLDSAGQLQHWEGWGQSQNMVRRQVSIAFRKFVGLVFYDHTRVWPSVGYDGVGAEDPGP